MNHRKIQFKNAFSISIYHYLFFLMMECIYFIMEEKTIHINGKIKELLHEFAVLKKVVFSCPKCGEKFEEESKPLFLPIHHECPNCKNEKLKFEMHRSTCATALLVRVVDSETEKFACFEMKYDLHGDIYPKIDQEITGKGYEVPCETIPVAMRQYVPNKMFCLTSVEY